MRFFSYDSFIILTKEMGDGDPSACGLGDGPNVIDCVTRACVNNMTQACFDRMFLNFPFFSQYLVTECRLDRADESLIIALSPNCRRVCNLDRDACRWRRQLYCSTKIGNPDATIRTLCACYWPKLVYTRLISLALESGTLALASAEQLKSISDLLLNSTNYPFCWNQDCSSSLYGEDTEIVLPCQSVGLCVQSIDVTNSKLPPNVILTNNCKLNAVIPPINPPSVPNVSIDISVWFYVGIGLVLLLLIATLVLIIIKSKTIVTKIPLQVPISVRSRH
jgi:hypothetical protein